MNPNITSLIAAERSEELLRRSTATRLSDSVVNEGRFPRRRHHLSGPIRRHFRRVSFAR